MNAQHATHRLHIIGRIDSREFLQSLTGQKTGAVRMEPPFNYQRLKIVQRKTIGLETEMIKNSTERNIQILSINHLKFE